MWGLGSQQVITANDFFTNKLMTFWSLFVVFIVYLGVFINYPLSKAVIFPGLFLGPLFFEFWSAD